MIKRFLITGGKTLNLPNGLYWLFNSNSQFNYAFVSAATPGRILPSRNSSDAPPPVET